MRSPPFIGAALLLWATLALAGCGQTGALYLPDETPEVTTPDTDNEQNDDAP